MANPGSLPDSSARTTGTGRLRVGRTLTAAMRLWWHNWRSLAVLALVVVAPLVIATELLTRVSAPDEVKIGIAVAVLSASVLGEVFCAGLAEHTVRHQQIGLPAQPWWRTAREVPVLRLAAVSVITAIVVLCGLLLLVVPGVVAFAWLVLATPLVSLERRGVRSALRGSVAMVRGSFWSVAALTIVTFVPVMLGDLVSEEIRRSHAPLWTELAVEVATDALAVALSAAIVVTLFDELSRAGGMRLSSATRQASRNRTRPPAAGR